jgi:hypothetical protein
MYGRFAETGVEVVLDSMFIFTAFALAIVTKYLGFPKVPFRFASRSARVACAVATTLDWSFPPAQYEEHAEQVSSLLHHHAGWH